MIQIMDALSLGLHALATVVLIGHYLLLALIYLPVFAKKQANPVSGIILSEISKRSRVWMYVSLGVFIATGIYLMFANPNYLGVGDFGNLFHKSGTMELDFHGEPYCSGRCIKNSKDLSGESIWMKQS